MSKIIEKTKADKLLSELTRHIQQGFIPKSAAHLTPFQKIFDDLTISDEGLLMQGDKMIFPERLWHTAFSNAHQGDTQG